MNSSDFLVSKWYADVVDAQTGDVTILYHSTLQWKKLRLQFSNSLQFVNRSKLRSSASFTRQYTAVLADGIFTLSGTAASGHWSASGQSITETLFEDDSGYILWECFMPSAAGKVQFVQRKAVYEGLGYVERLTFTVKPWEMPIQTLRWGRFLAERHAVVWIRWEGRAERNLIFHNGQKYTNVQITDDELRFGKHRLVLAEKYPLRNGSLITTVFKKFSWLRKLFPEGILNLQECKWQTRGQLLKDDILLTTGWSIHEKVEWM
jgi:hypothetical protein